MVLGSFCGISLAVASFPPHYSKDYTTKIYPRLSSKLSHVLQVRMARDPRSDAQNGTKRVLKGEARHGPRKRFRGENCWRYRS
jgi:hypothetical protein